VGVIHPSLIGPDDVDVLNGVCTTLSVREVYGYEPGWGVVGPQQQEEISALMAPQVSGNQPQAT
jgi:glutamate synthase (ferredoxin)